MWFRQAIEGQTIRVFGDGQQLRDLNYVDDVVDAMLLAAASDSAVGGIYNLGGEPISTASAQKELIPLATIAVLLPLIVGLVLQVEALGGFLVGIILSGQLLAVFLSNAGGAWDNAKKSIEDEPRDLVNNTGKGSERHKAGVVGDTVGDPMKDTAGPALNPMIKVANLVSLLAAPIIVKYPMMQTDGSLNYVVVVVALALLAATIWAISTSKAPVKELN